jgi:hypothetical protein
MWERIGEDVYEIASQDIRKIAFLISQSDLRELAVSHLNESTCSGLLLTSRG